MSTTAPEPFGVLTAIAVPLDRPNVDTDQIVPARFLRQPRSAGYQNFLFRDLREADPAFPLDQPAYRGARILVAADNFGCGSSREGAVWALAGFGLKAFIAPSFGDIFRENAFKNGVLPITLPRDRVKAIRDYVAAAPGGRITIDLERQTVKTPDGIVDPFDIDPFRKACLMEGVDEIALALKHEAALAEYEERQRRETPWLARPAP